ncbi:MAG: two-component system sensor histidine kinase NtrB [Moorellales bacterium]
MTGKLSRWLIYEVLLATGAVGGLAAWVVPVAGPQVGRVPTAVAFTLLGLAVGGWLCREFHRAFAAGCLQAEEYRHLESVQAAGQVALGLAHELRNPLAAVRGFLQLLARRLAGHPEAVRYLVLTLNEIDRATAILEDFMRLGRRPKAERTVADVGRIMEGVVELLQGEAFRRQVKIYHCYREGLAPVRGDPEQLRRVFLNLLLNALAAVPSEGRIWIGYRQSSGRVTAYIRDNGCGMDEETLARLGQPFFTTKPEGTGLGVALSFEIVRAHGGRIEVASRPGEGTVFSVHLPTVPELVGEVSPAFLPRRSRRFRFSLGEAKAVVRQTG